MAQSTPPHHAVQVVRHPERFSSNDRRVLARFFQIGSEDRVERIIERVLQLEEEQIEQLLARVLAAFENRHRDIRGTFLSHFEEVRAHVPRPQTLSEARRMLIGSYFTMEYALESAALFNPSIVPHPNQRGLADGEVRFLMSLRATGEGHVSSIVFRTGRIHGQGQIAFDPPSRFSSKLNVRTDRRYEKKLFFLKLIEMGAYNDSTRIVLERLEESFTLHQLDQALCDVRALKTWPPHFAETAENMLWLARSNYHLKLPPKTDPSEVVIFPSSENESRGIEDVRLTRFVDDDGTVTYYGTYTAYNGFRILPQILETRAFRDIAVHTLNGRFVQNKGMALFPRKIGGEYAMISRIDGENLFLMRSENVHFWNQAQRLQVPRYPWEFVQIGNCGAPIETERGWILLTHGVGPVRIYCIGAVLLDRENPAKIIGHLRDPLIVPQEDERDGYVPNVVYTCGAMLHGRQLLIPYALSDSATTFASVNVDQLLDQMVADGPVGEPTA